MQKFKVQSKLKSTTQKSLSIPPDVSSQPREITPQEIIAHDKSLPQSTDSYTDTVDPYKKIPSNVMPDKTNINEFPPLPPDMPQQVPSKHLNTKIKSLCEIDAQYDPAIDLNSPYDEEAVEIEYQAPTEQDFTIPKTLQEQVNQNRLIHRFLPRQCDLDCLMKEINRKVLCDTYLPIDYRDMKAAYINSPHFLDVYLYLLDNKIPCAHQA